MQINNDLVKFLEAAFADNGLIELRHHEVGNFRVMPDGQKKEIWRPRWFDNLDKLLAKAESLDHFGNLYFTLNQPAANVNKRQFLNRHDVTHYTRFFVDVDPVRKIGVAATAEEMLLARDRCYLMRDYLLHQGFPEPAIGRSGSGWHLHFRCAPMDAYFYEPMIKTMLRWLATEYSDGRVMIDTSVGNPSRICCLYGSRRRKGNATKERPHRSTAVQMPVRFETAPLQVLEPFAKTCQKALEKTPARHPIPERTSKIRYSKVDVVALFQSTGLYHGHLKDSAHAVTCPWSAEHSSIHSNHSDTVIFENAPGEWPGFYCHHNSCADRDVRHVLAKLGETTRSNEATSKRKNKPDATC